jgi:hypothetical protein
MAMLLSEEVNKLEVYEGIRTAHSHNPRRRITARTEKNFGSRLTFGVEPEGERVKSGGRRLL